MLNWTSGRPVLVVGKMFLDLKIQYQSQSKSSNKANMNVKILPFISVCSVQESVDVRRGYKVNKWALR